MAEFVQFRAEEWVTELELMERIGLFESKEIKSIVRKRKEFEYKIQRRSKCKEDFLKYIQFEVDLNRIIKARRKKTGIKAKRVEIEHSQTQRIGTLFKHAVFRFPNDVKLWMSFFKFCEGVKFLTLVSKMLVRMLQIHANKAELWVFAARWEFKQCSSITNARQFLTKGLRHHPSNALLYQELFKLELENRLQTENRIEKKKAKDENFIVDDVTNNIILGKVAEVIYDSAVKEISDADFKVSMLNISIKQKAPRTLKNKIIQELVKNHLDTEITWNTIAQEELKGFHCNINQLVKEEEKMEVDDPKEKPETIKTSFRNKIQNCINVYEEAVKKFNSVKMWSYYLDFVIKLNEKKKKLLVFKNNLLNNAMEGAMNSGKMAENYYIEWISRLQNAKKTRIELSDVLKKGTEDHPKSVKLWYARLKFTLTMDWEKGLEIFNEAIENLPDAAPLWTLVVKYLILKSSPKTEEVLQNGIKLGGKVAEALKPFYVEWLVKEKGIVEARIVFESSEMNLYPCLELYKKMTDLELSQQSPCLDKVRRCHELACKNFGEDCPSVWLDYVRFELKYGDVSKVAQIHKRALQYLKPESADEFLMEYNYFKIHVST